MIGAVVIFDNEILDAVRDSSWAFYKTICRRVVEAGLPVDMGSLHPKEEFCPYRLNIEIKVAMALVGATEFRIVPMEGARVVQWS